MYGEMAVQDDSHLTLLDASLFLVPEPVQGESSEFFPVPRLMYKERAIYDDIFLFSPTAYIGGELGI